MTTQQIRANIHVFNYFNDHSGAEIRYMWKDEMTSISLGYTFLLQELQAIGSVDDDISNIDEYQLTQWDAMNLVYRAHLTLEVDKDANIMGIDKAIKSINNSTY